MAYRKGKVFVKDTFAGIIEEIDTGYRFTYDDNYYNNKKSKPISLTMPLTQQEYTSNTLFPFFDGLIAEGWLLEVAIKTWKLNRNDRMAILLATCKDNIGYVSVEALK